MTSTNPLNSDDPAVRTKALLASFANKSATRRRRDNQGRPVGDPEPVTYDENGLLLKPARPAQ